ncbi:hypothetical protein J2T57_001648 [Natronocella acetinitrilica]|uniref:DUF932 domain-containing protein n=1 Tax=Natronocella acetinitrilica TaxID=414046 RepID=A0AAE3G4E4_9GAMM|nr:hypothetical protein [Natronocella acetinitrilica]MCP1674546.1 hypothetical protein [Natronocella acetinitrilica]
MRFELIRKARVSASRVLAESGEPCLHIVIDGRIEHTFGERSRETARLYAMDLATIERVFTGGTYFIYEGALVDYQLGDYRGFIHSEEAIDTLAGLIGVETPGRGARRAVNGLVNRTFSRHTNGFFLGGPADEFALDIPALGGDAGRFSNRLYLRWSPFSERVQTALHVERLICLNGMVGMAEAISYETPIVSGWQENLDVAMTRLKPQINETLESRFLEMNEVRASVRDVLAADDLLARRIREASASDDLAAADLLVRLRDHVDPRRHLAAYYGESVFSDRRLAEKAPAHTSLYDVFNIVTEAVSHSVDAGGENANDAALNALANRLVFDSMNAKHVSASVPRSQDSDPERAFFGKRD